MNRPNKELIQQALEKAVQAEKAWRAAWEDGIPAGRADTDAVSSGLSTARDFLQRFSEQL
jgi:predicted transcriptional regulator